MSEVIIHSVVGSPYGRAALIALEEKGVPYRMRPLGSGGSKGPEHLARHPFGRVPALEHDGFALYETQAILRYVDRAFAGPALSPIEPQRLARMDQALNICDCYLMRGVNDVIGFHRIVAPRLLGRAPDEAAIAEAMPRARLTLAQLQRLLGAKPYLADECLTLADILCGAHTEFLSQTPEWAALGAEFPEIAAWLARLEARPSFAATTIPSLARAVAA